MEKSTKICIKCNIEKPLDEFYFRKVSNKHSNTCKECSKLASIENYNNYKERIKKNKKEYYKNNKEKELEKRAIYYKNNKLKLYEYKKEYNEKNCEKIKQNRKKYYDKNRIKILEQKKEYYDNNKDSIKEKAIKAYYSNIKEHKERNKQYRIKNREEILDKKRKYNKTYNAKLSSLNSKNKRRSIIKKGNINTEDLKKLYRDTKNCYWCGDKLKNGNIHLDHYIPLSKNGTHTIDNIVLSCPDCNMSKYNKDPLEFAQTKGKLF